MNLSGTRGCHRRSGYEATMGTRDSLIRVEVLVLPCCPNLELATSRARQAIEHGPGGELAPRAAGRRSGRGPRAAFWLAHRALDGRDVGPARRPLAPTSAFSAACTTSMAADGSPAGRLDRAALRGETIEAAKRRLHTTAAASRGAEKALLFSTVSLPLALGSLIHLMKASSDTRLHFLRPLLPHMIRCPSTRSHRRASQPFPSIGSRRTRVGESRVRSSSPGFFRAHG